MSSATKKTIQTLLASLGYHMGAAMVKASSTPNEEFMAMEAARLFLLHSEECTEAAFTMILNERNLCMTKFVPG